MSHLTIRGFVLREQNYGESDKLLEILSVEHGLVTVAARAARRTKSRLLAASQVFTFADYQVFCHKGRYSLDSAELIESFYRLREDIERLVCAAHLAEVFIDLLRDNLADRRPYELWAYSAHELQGGNDPLLTVHVAQLRLLALEGLAPAIRICQSCQRQIEQPAYFSFALSGTVCNQPACRKTAAADIIPIRPGTVACIEHALTSPCNSLYHFSLSDAVRKEFIAFSNRYLSYQMEKPYKRLDLLQDLDLKGS